MMRRAITVLLISVTMMLVLMIKMIRITTIEQFDASNKMVAMLILVMTILT